jgi:hypothetical protein
MPGATGGTKMKRSSLVTTFRAASIMLLLVASTAQLTLASDDFLVHAQTRGRQHYQDLAVDEAGGFLIVWESGLFWNVGDVRGKRYDSDGNAVAGEYLLAAPVEGEQQQAPRICHRDGGGWAVIWRNTWVYGQDPQPAARVGVFGRFLAEDGTPLGDAFRVGSEFPTDLDIACLPGGGFFAAWDAPDLDGSYYGIFGRYVDDMGNLIGAQIQINTETEGEQGNFGDIRVAASPAGKVLVLWPSNCPVNHGSVACTVEPDGSASSAQARLFDESHNPTGPEFRVNTTTLGTQGSNGMAAAFNDEEEFIIVFSSGDVDTALCNDSTPCSDLLAQRYDATGAPVGGEITVNAVIRGDQIHPDIAYDGDDGYFVVWQHRPPDDGPDSIAGRRIGSDGTLEGNEFLVTSTAHRDDRSPRIASHDGVHVVAWTHFDASANRDVLARRLSGSLPECPETPVADCANDDGSTISLRDGGSDPSKITWKWSSAAGPGDASADLTGYSICIYDGTGSLVINAGAAAFAECRMGGCWSGKSGRYRFRDRSGEKFSVRTLSMRSGDVAKIRLKASGMGAPMSRMREMSVPLTVQLISTNGQCWQAGYNSMLMKERGVTARSQ